MKHVFFLLLLLNCLCHYAPAQDIQKEKWDEKPVIYQISEMMKQEPAIIILDKRRMEFADEKENLVMYKTLHRIVHINDDKGIESYNRIYLPVSSNADIIDMKARTILPDGKTIELDKNSIKDITEDGQVYKIFAMEGLVEGCEVEYYYTYRRNTSFFGREVIQGRLPVQQAVLELGAPSRLLFEIKAFNSSVKPFDTTFNNKRWLRVVENEIAAAEDEKYCAFEANLKRLEYKLSYNTSRTNNDRLFTWDELARRIHTNFSTCTDKEMRKVNDLTGDIKLKNLTTEQEKIAAVEDFIKTNFTSRDDIDGDDADNLEKIIKTKLASHTGMIRLFSAVFRNIGIAHEYVLAADRDKYSIDRNFENWNNCENNLIYFPSIKKYLAPTEAEYRFPWINPKWAAANAFYCRTTTIGSYTTAIGEVKQVPLEDFEKSVINTEADVELSKNADTLIINIRQIYSGYSAAVYRAIFNFSDDENKKLVTKEMIKFGTNSENLVSSNRENEGFENYHENKPFILSATVKAVELVEKAGNKTIIRIGDIIGPQVEMYQEKPRQFPMEIDYPHVLERKINFTIPPGYTVKNPDDIKIKHVFLDKGQVTMGFISDYTLEKNILSITIREEYRRSNYPLSQFDDFRKVINAAADFNKVALVLEKK